ncbi:MAG TPA: hypothetical protein VHC41_10810, partial [Mycobacteriales bacterium]|nr:hypothetical protein [Mycobacteriales bacterium]
MSTPDAVLLGADQLAQLECIALGLLPAWLELPVELLAGRSEVALRDREGVTVARWHAVGAAIPAAGGAVRGGNVQLADTPTSATYRGLRLAPDRVRAGLGAGSVTAVVGV